MILPLIKRIVYQKPEIFDKTVSSFREVCKFPNYRVDDGVTSSADMVTLYENTCTGLAMHNGKRKYLGHFAPEYKKSSFKDRLDYKIKQFQDETGQADALLTGGHDYADGSAQSIASYELGAEAAEVLDKNGVNFSMIFGKINPSYTDALAVTNDRFIITTHKKIGGNIPELSKNPDKNELNKMLERNYRTFELDDTHSIDIDV